MLKTLPCWPNAFSTTAEDVVYSLEFFYRISIHREISTVNGQELQTVNVFRSCTECIRSGQQHFQHLLYQWWVAVRLSEGYHSEFFLASFTDCYNLPTWNVILAKRRAGADRSSGGKKNTLYLGYNDIASHRFQYNFPRNFWKFNHLAILEKASL